MSHIKEYYEKTVVPALQEKFKYSNGMQVPKIEKALGVQIAYLDGYTIFPHWGLIDYSPGVPGAGKFRVLPLETT